MSTDDMPQAPEKIDRRRSKSLVKIGDRFGRLTVVSESFKGTGERGQLGIGLHAVYRLVVLTGEMARSIGEG